MKTGDLIQFKMIAAGRTDNPQYLEDGSWRTGILLGYGYPVNLNKPKDFENRAFKVLISNGKIISKLREQIEVINEN